MANPVTELLKPRPPGTPPWLTAVRLRPGGVVEPVAWTAAGVVVEGDTCLVPSARVVVILEGRAQPRSLPGEVWSACITSLAGRAGIRYRAAIRFDTPVDIRRTSEEDGSRA